jgi:oligoribonuclease NrnB/cAMP/cGMP phosphodiesterase (DHH superfamily)
LRDWKTVSEIICFHHNDADGRASAAIVRYALGGEVQFIECDYGTTTLGRSIPWETVAQAGRILVVDFSFPLEEMRRLAEGRSGEAFVWIDHHKSALAELASISDGGPQPWAGVRDVSEAACVLTWRYFFPQRPVPRAVVLIGDRDIWRWAEADTGAFNESLYNQDHRPENDVFWRPLLADDAAEGRAILARMVAEGARLRDIRLKNVRRLVHARGFEVQFEHRRTLAINTIGNGDIGQYGREQGYEIVYCYVDEMQPGGLATVVTLFSSQVDVSLIAQRYGGGGHAGAAGFSFPRAASPFPPGSDVKLEGSPASVR